MIENWQIVLAIIIVGLSIVMPIYYSHQKKKKAQQEELNKINKERELEDTPSIRGMIEKVKHLVVIKEN